MVVVVVRKERWFSLKISSMQPTKYSAKFDFELVDLLRKTSIASASKPKPNQNSLVSSATNFSPLNGT